MQRRETRITYFVIAVCLSLLAGWRWGGSIAERYFYDNFVEISPWPQIVIALLVFGVFFAIWQFIAGGGIRRIRDAIMASTRSIAQTIYFVVAAGVTVAFAIGVGGRIDANTDQAFSPLPQVIVGLGIGYILAVFWKIIFLHNFDTHLKDTDIRHKEHLYIWEMVFVHLRLPLSRLFKFLYHGVKGWREWVLRSAIVGIGGFFLWWFIRNSPAVHEAWRAWWPWITMVVLAWYALSWIVMIAVRYRGSGIIVTQTGEVWAVEMRFLNDWRNLWPAAKAIQIDFSQIDLRTLDELVNLPGLEPYVRKVDISYKNDPTVAASLRGVTLRGLDNISTASGEGKIFADVIKDQTKARIKANTPTP